MKLLTTLALSAAFAFAAFGCAQAETSVDTANKAEIEQIIKAYLLENPEIVRDALIELEAKERREAISSNTDRLFKDDRDPVLGKDNAKVTIVEFFDYNCGFCKRSTKWVENTLEKHPNDVRVIFKELPILDRSSKTSRMAARAALAAGRQGKYGEMHFALMEARGINEEKIDGLAKAIGLNMARFKGDIQDSAIDKHIDEVMALAQDIPMLTGTPFFVIGDEYVSGADTQQLDKLLEAALKG